MRATTKLKFDKLPSFETSPVFCLLDAETDAALRALPNVHARAVAALRFRQNIAGDAEHLHVTSDHIPIMQVAYLRAALMEYVGMEEVLPIDLAARGRQEKPFRISDTHDAMLIVLRELRHVQLQLVNTVFEISSVTALFRPGSEEHRADLPVLTVPRADLMQLKALRNASRFDPSEWACAIEWFADAQAKWGVDDVVRAGVQRYADALIAHYGLHAP
jgi:hypothetical protein